MKSKRKRVKKEPKIELVYSTNKVVLKLKPLINKVVTSIVNK